MTDTLKLRGRLHDAGPVFDLVLAGGRIRALDPVAPPHGPVEALAGRPDLGSPEHLLLPPLLDLQHNGSLGMGFNNPDLSPADLRRIRDLHLRHGVGRLLPTVITAPLERMARALSGLAAARQADCDLAAAFPGFHIEGPWLNPAEGFRGAHDPAHLLPPDLDDWKRLRDAAGGLLRIVTLAPELPGALPLIEAVVRDGVTVALAHADPDDACVRAAVAAGASMVTHFGNGMAATIHRHRNPLWSYLDEPRLVCGLIADGFHLPPPVLRTAVAAKGAAKVFLVSDVGDLAGMPPGEYEFCGKPAVVSPEGRLHLKGQEYLAGAWFPLDHCVGHAARVLGLPLAEAWALGSSAPARVMGLPGEEGLAPGGAGDVVLVDPTRKADSTAGLPAGAAPFIDAVFLAGRRVV